MQCVHILPCLLSISCFEYQGFRFVLAQHLQNGTDSQKTALKRKRFKAVLICLTELKLKIRPQLAVTGGCGFGSLRCWKNSYCWAFLR